MLNLRRHAAAVIRDADDHAFRLLQKPDTDFLPLVAEFDGIADEIGPYLTEQTLAAGDADGIEHRVEADVLLRPLGLQRNHGLTNLLVEPEDDTLLGEGLVFNLGKHENISHQCGKPVGVQKNSVQIFLPFGRGKGAVLQQHGIAFDCGQRGFEFVRDIGDEIVAECGDAVQLPHHGVEIPEGGLYLLELAGVADRDLIVSPGNLLGGVAELDHGRQDAPADEIGRQAACDGGDEQQSNQRGETEIPDEIHPLQQKEHACDGSEGKQHDHKDNQHVIGAHTEG